MLPIETHALVLRAVNYGEADRIVTLFGRKTGKVSALARGARKSVRRFTGLGSAALGVATLRERGGDVWSFESFDVLKPRTELATDLVAAAHAAYACELVERLVASHHPEEGVFDWLDRMLDCLALGAPASERLRAFELGLLTRLGLSPPLDRCAACDRDDIVQQGGRWNGDTLMLVCASCGTRGQPLSAAVLSSLRTLSETEVEDAAGLRLDNSLNRACRGFLMPVIEHHVGGPLKAMTFLAKLSRSGRAASSSDHGGEGTRTPPQPPPLTANRRGSRD